MATTKAERRLAAKREAKLEVKREAKRDAKRDAKKVIKKHKGRVMRKVVATRRGYYGEQLREVGDVFRVPVDEELGSWMVPEGDYVPEGEEELDDDEIVETPRRRVVRAKKPLATLPTEDGGVI